MSVLNEIKTKLDLLGSLGTLVLGTMPTDPDAIGSIYEYPGLAPEWKFGVVGIGYEFPFIQVVFRGAPYDYSGPRALAKIAWNSLAAVQPGALCAGVTTEYLIVRPKGSIFQIAPPDENFRLKIGFNCEIEKVPS